MYTVIQNRKIPYKCNHCDKAFSHDSQLKRHLRKHTGEKPYQCNDCEKVFSHECSLKHHLLTHTGEQPYKCSYCGRAFSIKSNLTRHIRIHTLEKPYKCDHCEQVFSQHIQLKCHLHMHSDEQPFKCSNCNKVFSCKKGLTQHTRIHTDEKPYKCRDCNEGFRQHFQLKRHLVTHTGEKPCNTTLIQSTSRSSLKQKLISIDGTNLSTMNENLDIKDEPLNGDWTVFWLKNEIEESNDTSKENDKKCLHKESILSEQQGIKYYSHSVLNNSINKDIVLNVQTEFDDEGESIIDKHAKGTSNSTHISHMKTHSFQESFPCNYCNKAFSNRYKLIEHLRLHNFSDTRENIYQCSQCVKDFANKIDFNVHMRIHTGVIRHECSNCNESFTVVSTFKKHLKACKASYQCSRCFKTFSNKDALVSHLSTHTNMKPYQCSQCAMTFTNKTNLLKHHFTHTKEKLNQCTHFLYTHKGKYVL